MRWMLARVQIDQQVIDDWTECVLEGDVRAIQAVFRKRNASGPKIFWYPPIDFLETPQHRFLLASWSGHADLRTIPRARQITADAAELREVAGYLALLDVAADGDDFIYRTFGTEIAAASEFDMTGRKLSMHPASAYIVEFAFAVYRAVLVRKAPVLTEHSPPADVSDTIWQRLVLPLAEDSGNVNHLLSCNVPIPRR